jgi:hypothetical protein
LEQVATIEESSAFEPSGLTQISAFGLAFGEVRGLTWTVHPFRTRVGDPKKVGDRHIGDFVDTKSLHFEITKSETPMSGAS